MRFDLTVKMDNAAFEVINGAALADIMKRLSSKIEELDLSPGDGGPISDLNGNKCGSWGIKATRKAGVSSAYLKGSRKHL